MSHLSPQKQHTLTYRNMDLLNLKKPWKAALAKCLAVCCLLFNWEEAASHWKGVFALEFAVTLWAIDWHWSEAGQCLHKGIDTDNRTTQVPQIKKTSSMLLIVLPMRILTLVTKTRLHYANSTWLYMLAHCSQGVKENLKNLKAVAVYS